MVYSGECLQAIRYLLCTLQVKFLNIYFYSHDISMHISFVILQLVGNLITLALMRDEEVNIY